MNYTPYGEWQELVDEYVQKGWKSEGAGEKYILLQKPETLRISVTENMEFDNEGNKIADPQWWVYLLRCSDSTYYCGITTNPARREYEHNTSARGAKYTFTRRPVKIVYWEGPMDKSQALKREMQVKSLKRSQKADLIAAFSPIVTPALDYEEQ